MPAYATIEYAFLKTDLTQNLVQEFYHAIQVNRIQFDKVYAWGCQEQMSLDEIVEWNQKKLHSNFVLGDDEHVSHDYRQILLSGSPYTELRVFILNEHERTVSFHLIAPEGEVYSRGYERLQDLSLSVWASLPVQVIQSYGELGDAWSIAELEHGKMPSVEFFACIPERLFSEKLMEEYTCQELRRGYLLQNPSAYTFENDM